MALFLLHPIAIHFPITFLLTGAVLHLINSYRLKRAELEFFNSFLLYLGTVAAWIAVGLGLLAQRTAEHIPAAWEVLSDHKELGIWTAVVFTGLCSWRILAKEKFKPLFTLAWVGAAVLLIATAYHGGELVYSFGMGVLNH